VAGADDGTTGSAPSDGMTWRPSHLLVAIWWGSAQRHTVIRYLRRQPLRPRWRLEVRDGGGGSGDGGIVAAADVGVLGLPEVGRTSAASLPTGLVVVLEEPAEVRSWRGAASLVLADDPCGHVAQAVAEAAQGRVWISDRVVPHLAEAWAGDGPGPAAGTAVTLDGRLASGEQSAPVEPLTPTEQETRDMVLAGMSNIEIAARRGVTLSTVKSCVSAVLQKYGCVSRGQLIARFVARRPPA
jgi:DNA-binding CsgD family transcriptional regulator